MADIWIALIVVGIIVAVVAALIVLACCKVSGNLSREEEKMQNAKCKMQNEQRLIDADALIAEIDEEMNPFFDLTKHYKVGYWNGLIEARRIAERMPTVDAVEVVRCKDCRDCEMCYPEKQLDKEATQAWLCKRYKMWRKPDDFCSYGERRDGE